MVSMEKPAVANGNSEFMQSESLWVLTDRYKMSFEERN